MNPKLKYKNSTKYFYHPVTDEVKDKNILKKKTGERFGVNAIGFQGVWTTSEIYSIIKIIPTICNNTRKISNCNSNKSKSNRNSKKKQ